MLTDVTLPKDSMGVVVTLESKMVAGCSSSGKKSKSTGSRARSQVKKVAQVATRWPSHIRTPVSITAIKIFRFGEIRRHIGFVQDNNSHSARSSGESIV